MDIYVLPRIASAPDVQPPAIMAFIISSRPRICFTVQSNDANNVPHKAKAPPVCGARRATD